MELIKYKLGDVCTFINGRAYSQPELLDSGKYQVLRVGNIFDGNHWYYSDMELEEDKYCNEGDLLYSWACTFGPYIWHGPKTIYHYHIWKVKPNDSLVDKSFLYYFLNHQTKGFMGSTHGSTMIHITKENMENFEVLLPSLKDQKKIASVLSALDDKIALNKKMNQKLEAMAKRLYDYWFVQYDFPDKNGLPYKTTGGPMTYNPTLKREIPAGWEVKSIFDAADVCYGFPFATEPFDEENLGESLKPYSVIRIRDIKDGSISAKTTETTNDKYKTEEGDLLVGMDGFFHMNFWHRNGDYVNQRIVRIRKKNLSTLVVYHQIAPFIKFKEEQAKGSTVGHLSDKDLKQLFILVPDSSSLSARFDSILNLMMKQNAENEKLITLRNRLLPLLMNGQITIG